MGNRMKVFQDSMSQHNVTNPDKLKLVKLIITIKYAILKFSKCKILVGKILTIQQALVKFEESLM